MIKQAHSQKFAWRGKSTSAEEEYLVNILTMPQARVAGNNLHYYSMNQKSKIIL